MFSIGKTRMMRLQRAEESMMIPVSIQYRSVTDGRTDGRKDGRTDGRKDGRTDRQNSCVNIARHPTAVLTHDKNLCKRILIKIVTFINTVAEFLWRRTLQVTRHLFWLDEFAVTIRTKQIRLSEKRREKEGPGGKGRTALLSRPL